MNFKKIVGILEIVIGIFIILSSTNGISMSSQNFGAEANINGVTYNIHNTPQGNVLIPNGVLVPYNEVTSEDVALSNLANSSSSFAISMSWLFLLIGIVLILEGILNIKNLK